MRTDHPGLAAAPARPVYLAAQLDTPTPIAHQLCLNGLSEATHNVIIGSCTVKLQHRLLRLLVFISTSMEDMRLWYEENENTRDLSIG